MVGLGLFVCMWLVCQLVVFFASQDAPAVIFMTHTDFTGVTLVIKDTFRF